MKSSDPASLQNLNDIVLPASIGWWPLATGWYFLLFVISVVLVVAMYRFLQQWKRNQYRREALLELEKLTVGIENPKQREWSLRQIPVLLKRTALSVYSREQVASLTGPDWFGFLNATLKAPAFTESTSRTLREIAYSSGDLMTVDPQDTVALLYASKYWLEHHQPTGR